MEDIFKQNLLTMRRPTRPGNFSEALFPGNYWMPNRSVARAASTEMSADYSEKKQVIESLERFAQEKLIESPEGIIEVEGGQISIKSSTTWDEVPSFEDTKELMKTLSISAEFQNVIFNGKKPGEIKIVFVTETLRNWNEVASELKQGLVSELLTGFPLKTAEFFERMIMAMKLTAPEVLLYSIEADGKDLSSDVMAIARHFRAEIIVTLGAKATQKILKVNDRLTLIHGQFFARSLSEDQVFQVVPLFHPSIIETNQNMKKTAWVDMQKIMRHLKKLP